MTDFWNIIINGDTKAIRDVYGNVYDQNLNMVNEYTVTFTRKETDYIDWDGYTDCYVFYLDQDGCTAYTYKTPPHLCLVIARRGQTPEKLYKVGEKSETTKTDIDTTLDERGKRYGSFEDGAEIMQHFKEYARGTPGWKKMKPIQREALDMIFHKIGRTLNGDPDYADSWHDICGFSKLVDDFLVDKAASRDAT